MLILGTAEIQNIVNPQERRRKLRSCILSKKVNDQYYLSIKNTMYPQCIDYKISNLKMMFTKFINIGKLGLLFTQPAHQILFHADEPRMVLMLLRQIEDIQKGKNVIIATRKMPKTIPAKQCPINSNPFDPMNVEFTAINHFDCRVLNMKHLQKLVIENCTLQSLPMELGNLPITYLSLSNSVLGTTQSARDTRWDLFTLDPICQTLSILNMDSISLYTLPFEILNLKKLYCLSVADTKLTYLLPIIGNLSMLTQLNVSNNSLRYLPDTLRSRFFQNLDISQNAFHHDSLSTDHINTYSETCNIDKAFVKKLSHLAFCSIVENGVKFKRKDIPRTLWHYFNVIGQCVICQKYKLPPFNVIKHATYTPNAHKIIRNSSSTQVPWQILQCCRN